MRGHRWDNRRRDPWTRFLAKLAYEEDCVVWTAGRIRDRYGVFAVEPGRTMLAHRYAYEYLVGPIPGEHDLHHKCRNTLCVLPWHLEPITPENHLLHPKRVNSANARKTHCPQGHPYDEANTGVNKRGQRYCRQCAREKMRLKHGWNPRK